MEKFDFQLKNDSERGHFLPNCGQNFCETLAPKSRETSLADLSLVSRETRRDFATLIGNEMETE